MAKKAARARKARRGLASKKKVSAKRKRPMATRRKSRPRATPKRAKPATRRSRREPERPSLRSIADALDAYIKHRRAQPSFSRAPLGVQAIAPPGDESREETWDTKLTRALQHIKAACQASPTYGDA